MATHSNGISALQLQRQLALGSYKSAWLLCAQATPAGFRGCPAQGLPRAALSAGPWAGHDPMNASEFNPINPSTRSAQLMRIEPLPMPDQALARQIDPLAVVLDDPSNDLRTPAMAL
jgi:hypothetical protein